MTYTNYLKHKTTELLTKHYGFKIEDSRFLSDIFIESLYQTLLEVDDLNIAKVGSIRYTEKGFVFKPSNVLRRDKDISKK